MAFRWGTGFPKIITHPTGELIPVQRDLSTDGQHGQSTEPQRPSHGLSPRRSQRHTVSADRDWVSGMQLKSQAHACHTLRRCVVTRLCAPDLQYQSVNPTTQVALFSDCMPQCTSAIINVTWTVYQGVMNSSSQTVQWTPFQSMSQYENIWFFGNRSSSSFSLHV